MDILVRNCLVSKSLDSVYHLFIPHRQYQSIWNDKDEVCPGEEHLAALTAWDRKSWAETRDTHFSSGVSKESMEAIEKVLYK